MRKRIFGFDLGIASIGWAIVELDNENTDVELGGAATGKIVATGVRTFPVAENPKDGASLAMPRRAARLARRVLRRKALRMSEIRKLLSDNGIVAPEKPQSGDKDIWELRAVNAMTGQMSSTELARVLLHMAKHRGFKSARKATEESDPEGGKILKAISENKELLSGYKTMAQAIYERAKNSAQHKMRNRGTVPVTKTDKKTGEIKIIYEQYYSASIPRSEIERELDIIFEQQKQYGIFTKELLDKYKEIAFRHRGIQSVAHMVGNCTFVPGEKRAPKESPTAELFVALSKINNLKISTDGEIRFLNGDERAAALELLKNTKDVKYSTLHKIFDKSTKVKFNDVQFKIEKEDKDNPDKIDELYLETAKNKKFYSMKGWHKLKSALGTDTMTDENLLWLDAAMTIIATEKNDADIEKQLKIANVPAQYIEKLKNLTTAKFVNLSLAAINKLIPELLTGKTYDKACDAVGFDHTKTGDTLVPRGKLLAVIPQEKMTRVPVVNRTVAQFRKVYNAMVRQFGAPDQINLEIGRELKKNHDERNDIKKRNDENNKERENAEKAYKELGLNQNPSGKDILRFRLYTQQNGKCMYSGNYIELHELEKCEIDHILPYSRSLDNSFNNKVLVKYSENQAKGNKTSAEYIKSKGNDEWNKFKALVASMNLGARKKDNLLNESFSDTENETKFRERNANDNAYIARFVSQYLNDGIDFSDSPRKDIQQRIQVRTGALTDYLRHQWGLVKNRDESDKHHAQDAIIIACATNGMVKYLSSVSAAFENKWELTRTKGEAWYKSLKTRFAEPWDNFRNEVLQNLDAVFVSRPPRKSATGEIHKDTIRPLKPTTKNFDKDIVKSGISIRGGVAANGSMLRTDVFMKRNNKGVAQYYLVPIYLSDMGKSLPNRIVTIGSPKSEWTELTPAYEFMFSLYPDDLVKIKKNETEIFGYYKGSNISTASITIEAHDRKTKNDGIGIKTLNSIEKYQVDVLGNFTKVAGEKRLELTNIKRKGRKQPKGVPNGLAYPSSDQTVQDIG
jgi:CRISPR-associated endonuclease Csn1